MQGQGLRDRVSEFSELGATIVGASFDTVEEQKRFADEQGFSFALISDPDRKIGELYGTARAADDPAVGFPKRTSFFNLSRWLNSGYLGPRFNYRFSDAW